MGMIIGLTLGLCAALFVYGDAQKRGMNAWGWAIFAFLIWIVGLPWYLIARKPILEDQNSNRESDQNVVELED